MAHQMVRLRFLAMLAALLGTNPAGLYFFEEIDNGIPSCSDESVDGFD